MSHDPQTLSPLEEFDEDDPVDVTQRLVRPGAVQRHLLPTLRVLAGRDLLRHVVLDADETVVLGRDERVHLRLNDPTVSKRHAQVTADSHGTITVKDLGSTNGTSVNSRPVSRAVLRPGDLLEVGAVSIRLDLLSLDEIGHLTRVVERLEAVNRDPLTGLLNRAFMDDELPVLIERWERSGIPVSCAFVDVDKFKSINDTFGHHVGDEVLRAVGRLVMVGVRDADPCVRYGGDEVVLFLPGSSEGKAAEVAERVRDYIDLHDWSRTADGLRVTSSFGVAERAEGESVLAWTQRADKALYAAKHAGRNRVQRASDLTI